MKGLLLLLAIAAATGCGSTPTRARVRHPTQLGNGIVNGFPSAETIRQQEASRDVSHREDEVLRQQQELDRQEQELQRQQESAKPLDRPDFGSCLSCPDAR